MEMYLEHLLSPKLAILADPSNFVRRVLRRDLVSFGLLANLTAMNRRRLFRGVDGIVDVGANRGQFAYMVSRACRGIPVVSFEPDPECFADLQGVFARFRIQGECFNLALSDHEGEAQFRVYPESVNSSFLKRYDETLRPSRIIDVKTSTLDALAETRIRFQRMFLKIDVQGFELAVLNGALATLPRSKLILVEVSFTPSYEGNARAEDVMTWLADHGFRFFDLLDVLRFPKSEGEGIKEADMLFVSKDLAPEGRA